MDSSERQREYVLRTVEERGVRMVRLWFTDVLGQLKSFAISPVELEGAFEEGMRFDGSSIDGFSRVQESDVLAKPDPNSFEILPWADGIGTSARVFCDIVNLDGSPFEGDPRQVLRRNLDQAREKGFSFYAAPEMEFFYFADGDPSAPPEPLDQASYFDLTTADVATDLRQRTIHTLEAMGIPVEYSHHEDAPSQHEIDLRYTDALTMADSVMTFRLVVKEVALEAGVHATFMPKPLTGLQGSGMHTHFSLFEGDTNAFYDPGDPRSLSKVAQSFIAGLLHHAREITAVTNQWVNSYKRLVVGYEAPIYTSWARNNRSVIVNVPPIKHGKAESARLEFRAPDPACNPYLAFSVILAAGLQGIEEGYPLTEETVVNLYELTDAERTAEGIATLPQSLSQALDLSGYPWKAVTDERAAVRNEPDDGWAGGLIVAANDPEGAFALCRTLRKRDLPLEPMLLLVSGGQLGDLELRDDLFDDFCLYPFQPLELEARLKHLFWRTGRGTRPELVEYGPLLLNLETYQAAIDATPLDLTYMEYELLKFLASHPGRVFTRETLLSRVWGYEYYGGARTVDVHIRRLRAKLGEEHANLIQTVRSVGYRFGQSRWGV